MKLCSEVSTFLAAVGYRKGKGILSEDERHWQWAALFTMLFPVHTILNFFFAFGFQLRWEKDAPLEAGHLL